MLTEAFMFTHRRQDYLWMMKHPDYVKCGMAFFAKYFRLTVSPYRVAILNMDSNTVEAPNTLVAKEMLTILDYTGNYRLAFPAPKTATNTTRFQLENYRIIGHNCVQAAEYLNNYETIICRKGSTEYQLRQYNNKHHRFVSTITNTFKHLFLRKIKRRRDNVKI